MASATDFIDTTSAAVFRPEIWQPLMIVQREANLVFGRSVDRRFEENLSFGNIVHVGTLTNLAARQKSDNNAITYETNTEVKEDITIDQDWYAAVAIESMIKVQADRDMLEKQSSKMTYALAEKVDDVLAALVDGETTNTVGTLAVENSDDELLRARQYLNDEKVPRGDRTFIFSPAAETGLMKLDRFVHNDYSSLHGGAQPVTEVDAAYMGDFYRTPILITTNVDGTNAAGHDNVLMHKEYMALVMQMAPKVYSQFDIDYFADKVAMEQIYGTKVMRGAAATVSATTYGHYSVFIKGA